MEDGQFVFTPSPNANVRQDYFPITGTYSVNDNFITLQGERQSDLQSDEFSAIANLDGTLEIEGESAQLDIVYAVTTTEQSAVRNFADTQLCWKYRLRQLSQP